MGLHDQKEFLKSIHPFDMLDEREINLAVKEITIAYYPKESILISQTIIPEKLFFIIKGVVNEYDKKELIREYRERDFFDENTLLYNKSEHIFIAAEDLICYELSKKGFLTLFNANKEFKNFFLLDITGKLQALSKRSNQNENISDFMTSKVNEAYLHKPCIVDENCTLEDAVKLSIKEKSSSIIIKTQNGYGIITDSDLKKYLLFGLKYLKTKVKNAANYPLVCIEWDDFLYNALFIFTKYSIKRIGVLKDGVLTGVLEQIDLLSFFANQTHLAIVKTQRATNIEELKEASKDYINIVKALHAKNVQFRYISKLISEINSKIFQKLFEFIIPLELRDKCCFIVMGSEGREEQVIRTDQDNALIIKDGMDKEKFYPYAKKINEALLSFGYPKCDGDIMLSNSYWCKNENEYKKELDKWIFTPDEESFMYFSIFFDARSVAGNEKLLESLKNYIFKQFDGKNDIYMAHFAKLSLLFETPVGFLSTILGKNRQIDIKKAGIFPIVQGVRALSLKYGIREFSTSQRIKSLYKKHILNDSLKDELLEAFEILSSLRVETGLRKIEHAKKPDNIIDPHDLTKIKQDLLKDSLQIVNNFKKFISHHFSLEKVL
jgi:CBS domain-containing protein